MAYESRHNRNGHYLDDYSKLRLFNLFDNLNRKELELVAENTEIQRLDPDHVVCVEGTDADCMFFIYDGMVAVSQKEVVFAHLESGDYFGEMSLITGRERNATVTTLVPSVLFRISAQVFDVLFEKSPTVMKNLLLTYDARLRRHNNVVVGQYLKLKAQYDELEDSHNRLLLSDKMASIGLLTSGIAHEINNPLFVITGYLNVLNDHLSEGEVPVETLEEITAKLNTASKSIERLVSGIKTYARIEETDPVPIDLNAAIRDSLNLVSYLYKQDGIELNTHLAEGSPFIMGNLGMLQQVLMNLFSNAKDAMEASDTKEITVDTFADGDRVVIEVSDTGCGIPEKDLKMVFLRAFTTKPVGKGSGMGLDLVSKLVRDMQGKISVQSESGKGATFRIEFPLHGDRI